MPQDAPYDPGPEPQDQSTKRACFLPFDQAAYHSGLVPCQWLTMSYFIAGLDYCVADQQGSLWGVSKKQIKTMMSQGHYVWVKSRDLVRVPGKILPCLEIKSCASFHQYRPVAQRIPVSKLDLDWLGPFAEQASIKGRGRTYHFDGRVSGSFNISKFASAAQNEPDQEQEAVDCSAEVWAQANARARGY